MLRYNSTDSALEFWNGAAWITLDGAGGTANAAGSDRQIQFNNGGTLLGADTNFVYTSAGDFIVGSYQLDDTGTGTEDNRMFFDVSKGAFRAGYTADDDWDDANVGDRSFAVGAGVRASGTAAIAFGASTTSSGYVTTAMGQNTSATQDYATAMGYYTTASGNSSVAMGREATASGAQSMAIGLGDATGTAPEVSGQGSLGIFMGNRSGINVADAYTMAIMGGDFVIGSYQLDDTTTGSENSRLFFDVSKSAFRAGYVDAAQWDDASVGNYSFASGNGTTASGGVSTALGLDTTASGGMSIAMGELSTASGSNSTAIGYSTTASGGVSTAIGSGSIASGHRSLATGWQTRASGIGSTAMGYQVIAGSGTAADGAGDGAFAIGLMDDTVTITTRPTVTGIQSMGIFMGDQDGGVDVASSNTLALLGGVMVIDPSVPATETAASTGGEQDLELDVEGQIGATHYCDEDGNNCFTAASVGSGSGVWQVTGGAGTEVVSTIATSAPYASADFVFGSATLSDAGTAAHDSRVYFDKSQSAFRAGLADGTQWDSPGQYSFAAGWNTTASNTASFAAGEETTASGYNSTALGSWTTAAGSMSLATGFETTASANYTTAMGYETTASGVHSMAIGLGDTSGTFPVVSGTSSIGIFMGDQSGVDVASANTMAIMGGNVGIGTVNPSSVLELQATANGDMLRLDGVQGTTTNYIAADVSGAEENVSARIGFRDNVGVHGAHIVFETKNGAGSGTSTTEVMRIEDGGNVGIGNNDPDEALDVTGNGLFSGNLGVAGATIDADVGVNVAMAVGDQDRAGVVNTLTLTGTHTAGRTNVGTYNFATNNANNNSNYSYITGTFNDVNNGAGDNYLEIHGTRNQIANYNTGTTGRGIGTLSSFANYGTGTMSQYYGNRVNIGNSTTGTIQEAYGLSSDITNSAGGEIGYGAGAIVGVTNDAGGNMYDAHGFESYVRNDEGTISFGAYGLDANIEQAVAGGTIYNAYGANVEITETAGTIDVAYLYRGIYSGTPNTAWGLHISGESYNTLSGKLMIGTTTDNAGVSLDLGSNTDSILLPVGTDAQQPGSPIEGMFRYNSDDNAIEFWNGTAWVSLDGTGGTASAAGSDRQIQFNDGGSALGADANFVYTSAGDFIVGSYQLDDTGTGSEDYRMFFDVSKGAFRAGITDDDDWDDANVGNYSVAMGSYTIASGPASTAMGQATTASGTYSTAFGRTTTASGYGATAMGRDNISSGDYSTTIGREVDVSGDHSMAIGLGDATTRPHVSGANSLGIFMGDQSGVDVSSANTMAIMGGQVGIGTALPATILDIEHAGGTGVSNPAILRLTNSTSQGSAWIEFYEETPTADYQSFQAGYYSSADGSTNEFRIAGGWTSGSPADIENNPYFRITRNTGTAAFENSVVVQDSGDADLIIGSTDNGDMATLSLFESYDQDMSAVTGTASGARVRYDGDENEFRIETVVSGTSTNILRIDRDSGYSLFEEDAIIQSADNADLFVASTTDGNNATIHMYEQYTGDIDETLTVTHGARIVYDGSTNLFQILTGNSGSFTDRFNIARDTGDITMSGTGALKIHAGTTAQQPGTPVEGMFRYNTDDNAIEFWNGSAWVSLDGTGGVASAAGNNREIQFNDGGSALGADTNFVYTSAGELIVGSYQLDDTGTGTEDARMFFDVSKGAFRAGSASETQWDDGNVGDYSFASGQDNIASAQSATALGQFNQVSANYSTAVGATNTVSGEAAFAAGIYNGVSGQSGIALGYGNEASGGYAAEGSFSVAIGNSNTASGIRSTALGFEATASGQDSMAIGLGNATTTAPEVSGESSLGIFMGDQDGVDVSSSNTMAILGGDFIVGSPQTDDDGTHDYRMFFDVSKGAFRAGAVTDDRWDDSNVGTSSFAVGEATRASGDYSAAMGYGTTASGFYSTAMGGGTNASDTYSTAMGGYTTASGQYSTAMGRDTIASGSYSIAIGLGDASTTDPTVSGTSSLGIFMGDQDGVELSQANTMSLMGGSFGIGTVAPISELHVVDNNADSEAVVTIGPGNTDGLELRYYGTNSYLRNGYNDSSSNGKMYFITGGNSWENPIFTLGAKAGAGVGIWDSTPDARFEITHDGATTTEDYIMVSSDDTDPNNGDIMILDTNGNLGLGTATPQASLDINSTDSILLPRGTTAQQPGSPVEGMFRYNSDDNAIEFWNGTAWVSLDGTGGTASAAGSDREIQFNDGGTALGADTNFVYTSAGDFIVGSYQTDDTGNTAEDMRMFFSKSHGAFRAGHVTGTHWDDVNIGDFSVAMGYDSEATAETSVSIGRDTTASGVSSVAMGNNTTASGTAATALGGYATASGFRSTAMGSGTTASTPYSTAFGRDTTASGDTSTALGREATASGDNSMAIGLGDATGTDPAVSGNNSIGIFMGDQSGIDVSSSNTMAILGGDFIVGSPQTDDDGTHDYRMFFDVSSGAFRAGYVAGTQWDNTGVASGSVAFGRDTTASNINAFASGRDTVASGATSTAMGSNTTASGQYSTAIGSSALAQNTSTTAIGYNVNVTGAYSMGLSGGQHTSTAPIVSGANSVGIFAGDQGDEDIATSNAVVMLADYVGVGTAAPDVMLDVTGDIEYTGTLTDVSDRRLKENIEPLSTEHGSLLNKIDQVKGYSFTMKDDEKHRTEYGVIAQELEEIFPDLVHTAKDEIGTKSVNYVGLIAPMIEATKELKAENDSLKEELASVNKSLEDISKQVALLNTAAGNNVGKASMLSYLWILLALMGGVGLSLIVQRKYIDKVRG